MQDKPKVGYTKKKTGHHKIHGKNKKMKANSSPSNLKAPSFDETKTFSNPADKALGTLTKGNLR